MLSEMGDKPWMWTPGKTEIQGKRVDFCFTVFCVSSTLLLLLLLLRFFADIGMGLLQRSNVDRRPVALQESPGLQHQCGPTERPSLAAWEALQCEDHHYWSLCTLSCKLIVLVRVSTIVLTPWPKVTQEGKGLFLLTVLRSHAITGGSRSRNSKQEPKKKTLRDAADSACFLRSVAQLTMARALSHQSPVKKMSHRFACLESSLTKTFSRLWVPLLS